MEEDPAHAGWIGRRPHAELDQSKRHSIDDNLRAPPYCPVADRFRPSPGVDIELPAGRLRCVAWKPRREHPIDYQGKREGRLALLLYESYGRTEVQWVMSVEVV